MRRILIVGSTGSIGTQALDVIERSDDLEVAGLAADSSWKLLLEQAERYGVERIALADPGAAALAAEHSGRSVLSGAEGLVELITEGDCDLVLNALVGSAGLGAVPTKRERHHSPANRSARGGRRAGHRPGEATERSSFR